MGEKKNSGTISVIDLYVSAIIAGKVVLWERLANINGDTKRKTQYIKVDIAKNILNLMDSPTFAILVANFPSLVLAILAWIKGEPFSRQNRPKTKYIQPCRTGNIKPTSPQEKQIRAIVIHRTFLTTHLLLFFYVEVSV